MVRVEVVVLYAEEKITVKRTEINLAVVPTMPQEKSSVKRVVELVASPIDTASTPGNVHIANQIVVSQLAPI